MTTNMNKHRGGSHLSRFEAMAQRLVEGSFGRFFGGRVAQQEIATQLMRAMEESYEAGGVLATYYDVFLHPDDYEGVLEPGLEERLANYLVQLAQQLDLLLPTRPRVTLLAQEGMRRNLVKVVAQHEPTVASRTQQLKRTAVDEMLDTVRTIRLIDPFLIIDGRQHVHLEQPLITLGRRTDNDIILNSPAVSRKHAQIRWRHGHFFIYDLGSNSGTQVNGKDVVESVLHPGDVITLSDVSLIYGEGASTELRQRVRQGDVPASESTQALPVLPLAQRGGKKQ
jgi:hypothetical protein